MKAYLAVGIDKHKTTSVIGVYADQFEAIKIIDHHRTLPHAYNDYEVQEWKGPISRLVCSTSKASRK